MINVSAKKMCEIIIAYWLKSIHLNKLTPKNWLNESIPNRLVLFIFLNTRCYYWTSDNNMILRRAGEQHFLLSCGSIITIVNCI